MRSFLQSWKQFFNQAGMSMAEVTIAAALAGGLALVVAQLGKNSSEISKRADTKFSGQNLAGMLTSRLSDTNACASTFSDLLDTAGELAAANLSGATSGTGISLTTGVYNKDGTIFLSKTGSYGQITLTGMVLRYVNVSAASGQLKVTGTYKLSGKNVQMKPIEIPINININGTAWNAASNCSAAGTYDNIWQTTSLGDGIYYDSGYVGIGTATPETLLEIERVGASGNLTYTYNGLGSATYVMRPMQKLTYTPFDDGTNSQYQNGIMVGPITNNTYGDVTNSFMSFGNTTYSGRNMESMVQLNNNTNWAASSGMYPVYGLSTLGNADVGDQVTAALVGGARMAPGVTLTDWSGSFTEGTLRGAQLSISGGINANPSYGYGGAAALYASDLTTGTFGGLTGDGSASATTNYTYAGYFVGKVFVSTAGIEMHTMGSAGTAPQFKATGFANDANGGAYLVLGKSRGTTQNTYTATADGDALSVIDAMGTNSSSAQRAATRIINYQEGPAGATYVPGGISFLTSDGTADAVERMRITSPGNIGIDVTGPKSKLTVGEISGLTPGNSLWTTAVYSEQASSGIALYARTKPTNSPTFFTGVYGYCGDTNSVSAYCSGVRGYGYHTNYSGGGRTYGTFGQAGNGTAGYNYGAYGYIAGTEGGAAVFGTTTGDIDVGTTKWAGYFNGATKIAGSTTLQPGAFGIGLYLANDSMALFRANAGVATGYIDLTNIQFRDSASGGSANIGIAGKLGVGNWAAAYPLDVTGDIRTSQCLRYNASTLGTCASDKRIKKDIHHFDLGLKHVLGINPVYYKHNGLGGHPVDTQEQIGVIAQELEKTVPQLISKQKVKMHKDDTELTEIKTVNYSPFIYMTINAIKELYQKVVALFESDSKQNREIASLKAENEKLKTEHEEMQKMLCEMNKKASFCKMK